jgi:FkbM family methyltransferase
MHGRPCVVVLTYARPDGLALLLDDIERNRPPDGLDVLVYDDATPNADTALTERIRAHGWSYSRAAVNHGKQGWWRLWNTILGDLRVRPAPLYYFLNDDMRLCRRFFERGAELWSAIDDHHKGSLYLHLSAERADLDGTCWTPVRAAVAGPVVHCGWVDCAAFMCDRRLFDALSWELQPIDGGRWHGQDQVSSGVGQQLSSRAHRAGLGLYRVAQSLTVHDCSPSLMSAEARRRWPMETVGFIDGDEEARSLVRRRPSVFASLATIPAREPGLRHVVEALLPQVDGLGVYLNEYDRVPAWLEREEIVVARSQDSGVRGDAGKFFWAGTTRGYQLVCDDDMDYPPDYVDRLVDGIERYGRRAVVGFHGCLLRDEITDYYTSRKLLHFTRALPADTPVHVLGTGVSGFHASAIGVSADDFPAPNMADIWLALLGQRRGVPFVCLRRDEGWLSELPGFRADSIYIRARRRAAVRGSGPGPETLTVREHGRWDLHEAVAAPPRETAGVATARVRRAVRPPWAEPARPAQGRLVRVHVSGPERAAILVLPERDHITEAVRRSGTYYERDLLDAIRERAAGGVFVDVGAHYGNHTTFFGLECAAERVVAIEPNPPALAGLQETVAENGLEHVVDAHHVAVHPVWRRVAVTSLPWSPRPGTPIQSNSGRVGIAQATAAEGDAPAAPLDEILSDVHGVSVVKVDAEGLSAEILASGRRLLQRDRPLVAAEAATDAAGHALRAVLSPLGYREVGSYCWTPTSLWEPIRAEGL